MGSVVKLLTMKTKHIFNNKLIIAIMSVLLMMMLSCFCATSISYADSKHLEIKEGKSYKLTCEKFVFEKPTEDSEKVLRKDLKPSTMKNSVEGAKFAKLKEGTEITCLEKEKNWIRIPSGWIKYNEGDFKPIKKEKS